MRHFCKWFSKEQGITLPNLRRWFSTKKNSHNSIYKIRWCWRNFETTRKVPFQKTSRCATSHPVAEHTGPAKTSPQGFGLVRKSIFAIATGAALSTAEKEHNKNRANSSDSLGRWSTDKLMFFFSIWSTKNHNCRYGNPTFSKMILFKFLVFHN